MGVKVNIDADIAGKLNNFTISRALNAAASQAALELTDYNTGVVPRLHGDLRATATPDGPDVDFNSLYAASQFNGGFTRKDGSKVTFSHYTTPGTGPHWDEAVQHNEVKMQRIRDAYLKGLEL